MIQPTTPHISADAAMSAVPSAINASASATGFSDLLSAAIYTVESSRDVARTATQDLLMNGKGEIHEVALLGQRAELTLELFQQVRNKLVQAYQEVMRMPM
jgi:flagellar hook-basal body complex protein FliE